MPANDPYAGLTPEERALVTSQSSPSSGAPSGSATADPYQGLSPQERQFVTSPATSSTPQVSPDQADWTTAFGGAAYRGFGDVMQGINRLSTSVGLPAFIPSSWGRDLTPTEQAAIQAHPLAAGAGQMFGQAVTAAPLAVPAGVGAEAVAPAAIGGVGSAMLGGAASGAVQNLLTSGEAPKDPLLWRAVSGAGLGAAGGAAGEYVRGLFGVPQTVASQAVLDAGNTAKNAGVDVLPENLPRAGGPGLATGAAANTKQVGQINQAFGDLLGATTPDFTPKVLDPAIASAGQNVSNTAAAGQIDWSAVEPALVKIGANTSDRRVHGLINDIMNQVDPATNQISGSDFQQLIRHNSDLDRATRSQAADLAEPARDIEQALSSGFAQSSPQGVADAYSNARLNYKLWLAIENNVRSTGGQINPATMLGTLTRWLPDTPRLGAPGTGTADQFADLARSAHLLFGGGGPAAAAAAPRGFMQSVGIGTGAGLAPSIAEFVRDPASLGNLLSWSAAHPVGTAMALGGLGVQGLRVAGHAYQRSQPFANALLQRGLQAPQNVLSPAFAAGVTSTVPPYVGQQRNALTPP